MKRRQVLRGLVGLGAIGGSLAAVGCAGAVPRALADFPVEGRIAYVSGTDIWIWTGAGKQRLTRDSRWEGPSWSPDGTMLAASAMGVSYSEIVLLDSSGKRIRQLTHNFSSVSVAQQAWGRKPAWSPDGKRIAYMGDDGPVADAGYTLIDMSLFLVDREGKSIRRVVTTAFFTGGLDWPTWSPDGKQIAFAAFETSKPSQIDAYNLETGERRSLTEYPEGAYAPAWSPDGKWIACTVRSSGRHEIYVLPAGGGAPVKLTDSGANLAPAWSPDGLQIAYIFQSGDDTFDIKVLKLSAANGLSVEAVKQLTSGEQIKTTSGLSWSR